MRFFQHAHRRCVLCLLCPQLLAQLLDSDLLVPADGPLGSELLIQLCVCVAKHLVRLLQLLHRRLQLGNVFALSLELLCLPLALSLLGSHSHSTGGTRVLHQLLQLRIVRLDRCSLVGQFVDKLLLAGAFLVFFVNFSAQCLQLL